MAAMPEVAFFDRVRAGDIGAVRNVLAQRKGAAHWQQTSNGQCPLHVAAMTGHRLIAAEIVKAGAEIEARDHLGRTPLLQAARSGQHHVIDFLLLQKADIHAVDKDGNTPLHLAAEGISADTIIMLINRGADMTRRNHDGGTPIDLALAGGNKAMAAVIRAEADKQIAAQGGVPKGAPLHETLRDISLPKTVAPRKRR